MLFRSEGFHGRALALREALAGRGEALADVLRRNAYGGTPAPPAEGVALLEAYVRSERDRLASTARNDLVK